MDLNILPKIPLLIAAALLCLLLTASETRAQSNVPATPTLGSLTIGEKWLGAAWTAPSSNGGSAVIAYDVRHIRNDANWTEARDVWTAGSGDLQHIVTGLTATKRYDIQVRAVNANGDGAWSATKEGTPADAGSSRTSAITLLLATDSTSKLHPTHDNRFSAAIASAGDVDYYKIVVSSTHAPSAFEFRITARSDIDTLGTLLDSGGNELGTSDYGGTTNPEDFFLWGDMSASTYYIEVEAYDATATGDYELSVRTFPDTSSRSNAIDLPLDYMTAGNIDPGSDEDYY